MKKLIVIAIFLSILINTYSRDINIKIRDISRFEIVDNKQFFIIVYCYNENKYVKYELFSKAQIESIAYIYYNAKRSQITISVK